MTFLALTGSPSHSDPITGRVTGRPPTQLAPLDLEAMSTVSVKLYSTDAEGTDYGARQQKGYQILPFSSQSKVIPQNVTGL